jgi:hypothetical protein
MQRYIQQHDKLFPHHPQLFLRSDGTVPARGLFMQWIKQILAGNVGGHSMCSGRATALAIAGVPDNHIQAMGLVIRRLPAVHSEAPCVITGTYNGTSCLRPPTLNFVQSLLFFIHHQSHPSIALLQHSLRLVSPLHSLRRSTHSFTFTFRHNNTCRSIGWFLATSVCVTHHDKSSFRQY